MLQPRLVKKAHGRERSQAATQERSPQKHTFPDPPSMPDGPCLIHSEQDKGKQVHRQQIALKRPGSCLKDHPQ